MPLISTAAPIRYIPELLQVQDFEAHSAAQAKFERDWKIRFGICLVASVFGGAFIFLTVITL